MAQPRTFPLEPAEARELPEVWIPDFSRSGERCGLLEGPALAVAMQFKPRMDTDSHGWR